MIYWPTDPAIEAGFITWASRELDTEIREARALGFLRGREIRGVVLYYQWIERYRNLEASICVKRPFAFTRGEVRWMLWYPFGGLGANRLQVTAAKRNKRSWKMVEKLGFTYEGKGRKAFGDDDAKVYSMLSAEWQASPWHMEIEDGQEQRQRSGGT